MIINGNFAGLVTNGDTMNKEIARVLWETNHEFKRDYFGLTKKLSHKMMIFSIAIYTCWNVFLEIWLKLKV